MIKPIQLSRRSPVHELIASLNPVCGLVHQMSVALRFKDSEKVRKTSRELALCDVSCLPKLAVKGPGALKWLEKAGVDVPSSIHKCLSLDGGGLIIRIDREEVLLEDGPRGMVVYDLKDTYRSEDPSVILVDRQDASFILSGVKTNELLSQTCGVDFSQINGNLVMTSVAGVSCHLLPIEVAGSTVFRIWVDATYGVYLWQALLEIILELGGDAVGLAYFYPHLTDGLT